MKRWWRSKSPRRGSRWTASFRERGRAAELERDGEIGAAALHTHVFVHCGRAPLCVACVRLRKGPQRARGDPMSGPSRALAMKRSSRSCWSIRFSCYMAEWDLFVFVRFQKVFLFGLFCPPPPPPSSSYCPNKRAASQCVRVCVLVCCLGGASN